MLKLPFYVDTPWAAGLFTLAVALGFAFLLWAYRRDTMIGRSLQWYFRRRLSKLDSERALRWGRVVLIAMIAAFGACALFGMAVGTGLIKNGDAPRPLTMEEFLQKHSK
jgi:hypothetical protein